MAAPIRLGGYGRVAVHPPKSGRPGKAKPPKPDAAPLRVTNRYPPMVIDNWWQSNTPPASLPSGQQPYLPGVSPTLPAGSSDMASAQKLVDAILAGNQKAIDSIHQQMQADNAAREAHIRAVYGALAEMQKGVAPQVQQTYQNAATDTSTFAKGYSDGLQRALAGDTAQGNAILQNIGAPQGQMLSGQRGQQAADVLYGTGGDIPASALTREGAALSSAAAQLPGTALGYGTQQALQSSAAGQQRIDDFLSQSGLAMAQKRSDLLAQEYSALQGQRQTAKAQRLTVAGNRQARFDRLAEVRSAQTGYVWVSTSTGIKPKRDAKGRLVPIGLTPGEQVSAAGVKQRAQTAAQARQDRQTVAAIKQANTAGYTVDPSTGKQTLRPGYSLAPDGKTVLPPGYGWRNGHPVRLTAPKATKGSGVKPLSRSQVLKLTGVAAQGADAAYHGVRSPDGSFNDWTDSKGVVHPGAPPISYGAFLIEARKEGIPEWLAKREANRYYHKGERGRPGKSPGYQAPLPGAVPSYNAQGQPTR